MLRPNEIKQLWDHYMGGDIPKTKETSVSQTNSPSIPIAGDQPFFPFQLDDLLYWVMRRKDGMVVKYRVVGPHEVGNGAEKQTTLVFPAGAAGTAPAYVKGLGEWCKHDPAAEPVWTNGKVDLYIANANGCRGYKDDFDFLLDCGNILPLHYIKGGGAELILQGDDSLCTQLSKFAVGEKSHPRCVKIDWDDREAPPLKFDFWPALYKRLSGTVLTACQGGHGRSGTSLVCLMMVANPEYTPADAVIHLRAIHCPRAIESVVQHNYIGEFGKWLGRPNDIERVSGIKDFKKAFMELGHASSKPYQDRLQTK